MSRPWRVLFVITSSDFGGTESFLVQLAGGLDRAQFLPSVCSLRPAGRAARQLAEAGVPVASLGMSERPRLREMATGFAALRRTIRREAIDLVQPLLYRATALAAWAARLSGRRPVVVGGQRSLQPLTGGGAAWAARRSYPLCRKIVAVSGAVRDELVGRQGVASQRVVVIPNGVDTDRFQPGERSRARAALGIDLPETSGAAIVVGSVGRLSPEKGFLVLLEALARAREQAPALRLVLAGDGPQRAALEHRAGELGLNGSVHFLGHHDDPPALYPAFDLFALPSFEEGSPNALLEAMACGCCAVASRVGGVPEVLTDRREGRLVAPGAAGELAAVLTELAADPELARRLGAAARRRALAEHDIRHTVRRHEELYASLLTVPPGSTPGGAG